MRVLLPTVAAVVFAVPAAAGDHTAPRPDIVKTAAAAGSFKTLLNCLIAADLTDALKGDGPFTVFAPTDEAFQKLPKGTLESLLLPENKAKLTAILSYHVVPNKASFNLSAGVEGEKYPFKTLGGKTVTLRKDGEGFSVNDSRIVKSNVLCKNGSVQVIDAVLLPDADERAKPTPAGNTIPVVATKAGKFRTLLAAVTAAELADVLGGAGPFTVFAPTDEAFKKLTKGTVETLLQPENKDQLVTLLKYHVVAGKVSAKAAVAAGTAKTLQGDSVSITIRDGRLTINSSAVTQSDVAADNGVIHVIDRVLTPGK